MVKGNLLTEGALRATAGDLVERDALLKERFGIAQGELKVIRKIPDLELRLIPGAELLLNKAHNVARGAESSQITSYTLAAIVCDEWATPDRQRRIVSTLLKRRYSGAAPDTRFHLSYPHFLREEIGAYAGNLLDAESIYPNFHPSDDDFLRSTKLPLSTSLDVAYLLGVFWSRGHITSNKERLTLVLEGHEDPIIENDSKHFPYFDTLPPRLFRQFNFHTSAKPIRVKPQDVSIHGRKFTVDESFYARINVGSNAICSWLMEDIGLYTSDGKPNLLIDKEFNMTLDGSIIPNTNYLISFLAGVIDGGGKIHTWKNPDDEKSYPYAIYFSNDPNRYLTVDRIVSILHDTYGIELRSRFDAKEATLFDPRTRSYVSTGLIKKIYNAKLLHNSHHLKKLGRCI